VWGWGGWAPHTQASNVLVDVTASPPRVKLCDFSVAYSHSVTQAGLGLGCDACVGTPRWMAPEVVRARGSGEPPYGPAVDVWSFGALIAEVRVRCSDATVANRIVRVWYGATENGP
jgi:serine/threonine protein kinase